MNDGEQKVSSSSSSLLGGMPQKFNFGIRDGRKQVMKVSPPSGTWLGKPCLCRDGGCVSIISRFSNLVAESASNWEESAWVRSLDPLWRKRDLSMGGSLWMGWQPMEDPRRAPRGIMRRENIIEIEVAPMEAQLAFHFTQENWRACFEIDCDSPRY